MVLQIVCDKGREAPIVYLEEHSPFPLQIQQITTGDYAIMDDEQIITIIERKTWSDLADTIKDPKRRANHKKLLDLRTQTNCSIVYLIEGTAFPSRTRSFNRVPMSSIMAQLDHWMIRDNCHIVQTQDAEDTAHRIITLTKNIQTISFGNRFIGTPNDIGSVATPDNPVDTNDIGSVATPDNPVDTNANPVDTNANPVDTNDTKGGLELLTKRNKKEDDTIIHSMYLALHGVTVLSYPSLSKTYSIQEILNGNTSLDILENLKYPSGGRFGPKRAKDIANNKTRISVHIKVLAEIPLITTDTAKLILKKYSINQLINGEVTQHDIANIVKKTTIANGKVKTQRIGPSAAKNVIRLISLIK